MNVAIYLRQGYGGQDVEVLPIPMLPVVNSWWGGLSPSRRPPMRANVNKQNRFGDFRLSSRELDVCHSPIRNSELLV